MSHRVGFHLALSVARGAGLDPVVPQRCGDGPFGSLKHFLKPAEVRQRPIKGLWEVSRPVSEDVVSS